MSQYIIKVFLTTALVIAVSEVSKRSTLVGGFLVPLVSFLAMIWLYLDTKDAMKVASLSTSVFWLVLPSLVFFIALAPLLKMKLNFYLSFALATALMLACYGVMILVLKKFGINR